jgi:Cys-rich repeat protein
MVVVTVGVLGLSCGSKSAATPVALDDFAAEAGAAVCDSFVRCHEISDVDICTAFYANVFGTATFESVASMVAAARADKAAYDAAKAGACLDKIRHTACNATAPNPVQECAGAFSGKVADGDRCIVTVECSGPNSTCADVGGDPATGNLCNGICTAAPGFCRDDAQCPAGQVCDPAADGNGTVCMPPVAPGGVDQPCGSDRTCQPGLHCEPVISTGAAPSFVCKGPAHLGAACRGLPGECDDGLVCVPSDDGSSQTCMTPAGLGDACQAFQQCGGSLLSSIGCDPTTHTCVAVPSSGPCVAGRIEGCDPRTSYCNMTQTTPTCAPNVAIGQACAGPLSCGLFVNATCDAGTGTNATCMVPTAALCTP